MIEVDIDSNLLSLDLVYTWVISWHGFFSFVAVAVSIYLLGRWAPFAGKTPQGEDLVTSDDIYSTAIWVIIGGVIGARLVHVIDNWGDVYSQNPAQVFAIYSGGIGLWGGIVGGFAGGAAYSLFAKLPVGIIADLTAPVLPFAQSIGRLGDIVNGEHCAKATDLFFGMQWVDESSPARLCSNGIVNHAQPVIIYEMLWNTISLVILWRLRGRLQPDGMLFALYAALYAVGRFGISFLREDRVWALGMQEAHYIALLVLVVTVPILAMKARFATPAWAGGDPDAAPVRERGTRAERRRRRR